MRLVMKAFIDIMAGAALWTCPVGDALAGEKAAGRGDVRIVSWDFKKGLPPDWRAGGMQVRSDKEKPFAAVTGNDPMLTLGKAFLIPGGECVRVRMAVSAGKTAQIFWGFMPQEADSLRTPLTADGKMHDYEFPVPCDTRGTPRFDPTDTRASLRIESIAIPTAPSRSVLARALYWDHRVLRAGRKERLSLALQNTGKGPARATARLTVPAGITLHSPAVQKIKLAPAQKLDRLPKPATYDILEATWLVEAKSPVKGEFKVGIEREPGPSTELTIPGTFERAAKVTKKDYAPEPVPAKTKYLIGAHYFPGFREGTHYGWTRIAPYPMRKPLLGWYDEGSPEVADWEIKWALEHGISFFLYCWYRPRGNEGKPVKYRLGHAIHDGLLKARFRDKFKFCIMYENAGGGVAGINGMMKNLLPFWLDNYFTHPSYLRIDNKAVLAVYRLNKFCSQLGKTPEKVKNAIAKMNEACRKRDLDGLLLLACGGDVEKYGFDYTFPYALRGGTAIGPRTIPSVSMGWSNEPWGRGKGGNRLTPRQFKKSCEEMKKKMDALPENHVGRRLLLIDNWNEWGEGHYILPHRQYGFGYLDAIREVFTDAPAKHVDVVPEDIGRGPYDTLYRKAIAPQQQ